MTYRTETFVMYAILYQPKEDGSCDQTVYKVTVSNEHDGRSLYQEKLSMSYFGTRELKRAHPNKHRSIKWTSLYRTEDYESLQNTNVRCGIPRATYTEVGPCWYDFFKEIGYDKQRKRYDKK